MLKKTIFLRLIRFERGRFYREEWGLKAPSQRGSIRAVRIAAESGARPPAFAVADTRPPRLMRTPPCPWASGGQFLRTNRILPDRSQKGLKPPALRWDHCTQKEERVDRSEGAPPKVLHD